MAELAVFVSQTIHLLLFTWNASIRQLYRNNDCSFIKCFADLSWRVLKIFSDWFEFMICACPMNRHCLSWGGMWTCEQRHHLPTTSESSHESGRLSTSPGEPSDDIHCKYTNSAAINNKNCFLIKVRKNSAKKDNPRTIIHHLLLPVYHNRLSHVHE